MGLCYATATYALCSVAVLYGDSQEFNPPILKKKKRAQTFPAIAAIPTRV